MGFIAKVVVRIILNGAALWAAAQYIPGFSLAEGTPTLVVGAIVLALLNTFLRPILMLISAPLRWLTLGLFTIVVYMAILWTADALLASLTISNLKALFLSALLIGLANAVL